MPDKEQRHGGAKPEVKVAAPGAELFVTDIVKHVPSESEKAHGTEEERAIGTVAAGVPRMTDMDGQQRAEQQHEPQRGEAVDFHQPWLEFGPPGTRSARFIEAVQPGP